MKSLYNRMLSGNLGDDIMPYAPKKKNWLIPLLANAAISFATSKIASNQNNNTVKDTESRAFARQKELNADQYYYEKKLMDYQNDINVSNWNMENEYNTPVNQVQRLIEAGVNPNNVLGGIGTALGGDLGDVSKGSVNTGSAPMGNASVAGLDLSGLANAFSDAVGTSLDPAKRSEIELNKSQAKLNEANAKMVDTQQSVVLDQAHADIALKESQRSLNESNVGLTDVQKRAAEYQLDNLMPLTKKLNEEQITNLISATKQLDEQTELIRKNQNLADAQIETQKHQQKALDAQANAANASAAASMSQVGVNEANVNKINQETANLQKQGNILSADEQIAKVRKEISESIGVDINDLETTERVNAELRHRGFTSEQIDKFWYAWQTGLTVAYERTFKKDATGNTIRGVEAGGNLIPKLFKGSSKGTNANGYNPQKPGYSGIGDD